MYFLHRQPTHPHTFTGTPALCVRHPDRAQTGERDSWKSWRIFFKWDPSSSTFALQTTRDDPGWTSDLNRRKHSRFPRHRHVSCVIWLLFTVNMLSCYTALHGCGRRPPKCHLIARLTCQESSHSARRPGSLSRVLKMGNWYKTFELNQPNITASITSIDVFTKKSFFFILASQELVMSKDHCRKQSCINLQLPKRWGWSSLLQEAEHFTFKVSCTHTHTHTFMRLIWIWVQESWRAFLGARVEQASDLWYLTQHLRPTY